MLKNENRLVTKQNKNAEKLPYSEICFVGVNDLVTEKLKIPG